MAEAGGGHPPPPLHVGTPKREIEERLDPKCPFCRHPVPKYQAESDRNLMKRAKTNDPVAQGRMGSKCHREGDYKGAFECWTKAVELGSVQAHYQLSIMYQLGEGVKRDKKKGVHHLEQRQRFGQRFPRDYPIALTPQHNFTTREHDENDDQNGDSIQLAVRIPSMSHTFNSQTNTGCYMKFINCYVPYFLSDIKLYLVSPYSITQRSYPNAMGNCALKTARNVDSQTQLAVLGTNNFRMLYGGGDGHLDYTP
eukprot:scaffold184_cov122-Skeletonema_menzelii.AAC.3